MSFTGLAILYIIIWWVVFFVILPIDVNRQKTDKIEGEDPGSPENPKMFKKFLYCSGITTIIGSKQVSLGVTFSQGLANPEINKNTGDIIYIDNRSLISRDSRQKEDVKIILEF